jgi:hypothetical protein
MIGIQAIRVCAASALSLGIAAAAYAQEGTTNKLDIRLRGYDCTLVTGVFVVMLDDDEREIVADKVGNCHWTADTSPDRFLTNLTHFSLRLVGMARTNCARATWDETSAVAILQIVPHGPVQQITITPDPASIRLPYVREVPGSDKDIFCTENGVLPRKVRDVHFESEKLRLLLFENKKDVCGLMVNDLPAIKKGREKKGAALLLKRSDVVDALAKQRNGTDACYMPNLSSAAIDISEKALRDRKLTSLTIKVDP